MPDLERAHALVAAVLSTVAGGRADQLREALDLIDTARAQHTDAAAA